jgi:hypothetical protein
LNSSTQLVFPPNPQYGKIVSKNERGSETMGVFRGLGKGLGTLSDVVFTGSGKLAGKALKSKWVEDVGRGAGYASKSALDTAGQFVDGTVQGAYGLVKQDKQHQQNGLADIKDSTGRTFKGIGSTLVYTGRNVKTTFKGIVQKDREQFFYGVKNLGKVATISAIAIGFIDVIDGADTVFADEVDTRNGSLVGTEHPETGVLFVERTIELPDGKVIEGVFPVFESNFNVVIAEQFYEASDDTHFLIANETLAQSIQEDPSIARELNLTQTDVQALENSVTPDGYVWHHNEQPGLLQLVNEEDHANTGHTGGRSLWGGGTDNR